MARRGQASKGDWQTEPMPEKSTTIELNQEFSKTQMEAIRNGCVPEQMEDKWFIYFNQSEGKLYLHRSWTGYCIYIVQFEERGDTFTATTAIVNRDSSQYGCTNDKKDKKTALTVIGSVLLGEFGFLGDPIQSWSVLGRRSLQ